VCALAHRYGEVEPLSSLDDVLEMDAHRVAVGRCDDGLVAEALPRMAG
jgi:hypothetical protein